VALPAILIAGAAIRLIELGKESLWYDELYTVWATLLPLDVIYKEVPASGHPILYYVVAHFWNQLSGGEAWYRMISVVAGVAAIWFVYLLGKELFSHRVGLWGAAFMAMSPLLVWYSRDATDYAWLVTLATLSEYFLVRSVRRGGRNWIYYVITTLAVLFSHYYAFILLAAEIVLFLFITDRSRKQIRSWLFSLAALSLLYMPLANFNRGATSTFIFQLPSINTLMAIPVAPFYFALGYVGNEGSGAAPIGPRVRAWAFLVILAILFTGLLVFIRPIITSLRGRAGLGLLVCTAMLVVLPPLVRAQNIAGRDLVLGGPLFLILVALVITSAPRRLGMLAGAVVFIGLCGLTIGQLFLTHTDDWRGVITIMKAEARQGDELLCFPLHHCAMAQAIYDGELPLKGGTIERSDNSLVSLQVVPGWPGYIEGYGPPENNPVYQGTALVAALHDRLADAEGVWLLNETGASGQIFDATAVENGLSDRWKLVSDYNFDTLDLKYYRLRVDGS